MLEVIILFTKDEKIIITQPVREVCYGRKITAEEKIYYRHFFKGLLFNVSDIKCFEVEMDSLARYYRIQLILDNDKKIKYTIAQENKENLIFLLNLLKMGIEQI